MIQYDYHARGYESMLPDLDRIGRADLVKAIQRVISESWERGITKVYDPAR